MEKLKTKYADELARFAKQKSEIRRLWNVDETTAGFLYLTAILHKAQYLLELGTSNGYSTFWLSLAAENNGGIVHTVEVDKKRYQMAKENLHTRSNIAMHYGLAEDIIPTLRWGIDFVFIDAGKPAYLDYLTLLLPTLSPGALVLADNVNSHPETTAAYTEYMRKSESFTSLTLPLEAGLEMSVYQPNSK